MFQNRYITKGVDAEIPLALQQFLWDCITQMPEPRDYFQVFRLSVCQGLQEIIHEQKIPVFKQRHLLAIPNPVTTKIYVIDDGEHCTMLLAEEY